jgi:hypothetical protein
MTELPEDNWTLEQLVVFAKGKFKRWAEDAWDLGKAFNLMRNKVPHGNTKKGGWRKWCSTEFPDLSYKQIDNYCKLNDRFERESLDGLKITEALRKADIISKEPAKRSKCKSKTPCALCSRSKELSVALLEEGIKRLESKLAGLRLPLAS